MSGHQDHEKALANSARMVRPECTRRVRARRQPDLVCEQGNRILLRVAVKWCYWPGPWLVVLLLWSLEDSVCGCYRVCTALFAIPGQPPFRCIDDKESPRVLAYAHRYEDTMGAQHSDMGAFGKIRMYLQRLGGKFLLRYEEYQSVEVLSPPCPGAFVPSQQIGISAHGRRVH